jgi:hypothetical protein
MTDEQEYSGAICGGYWPLGVPIPMTYELATGMGYIALNRDGETVWTAPPDWAYCLKPKKMRWAEAKARKESDRKWELLFVDAFWSATFERQGRNLWPAIRVGPGAA